MLLFLPSYLIAVATVVVEVTPKSMSAQIATRWLVSHCFCFFMLFVLCSFFVILFNCYCHYCGGSHTDIHVGSDYNKMVGESMLLLFILFVLCYVSTISFNCFCHCHGGSHAQINVSSDYNEMVGESL